MKCCVRLVFWITTSLLLSVSPAVPAEPVAIVEEVRAASSSVQFMDYLSEGRVIQLDPGETLTIGYLRSCLRETIAGGSVTVGRERSVVEGGKVDSQKVECDGGSLRLSAEQAGKSTVMVFRRRRDGTTQPDMRVYSRSPIFKVTNGAEQLVIERLDQREAPLTLPLPSPIVDLAKNGQPLAPAGTYRATAGDRAVTFVVDADASLVVGPVLGRLVHF